MNYRGDFAAGSSVDVMFTTHAASGAAVAPLTGFEAADVIVYKDNSATQRTSTAGITMTSPFDSITGLHQIHIDLADNTDAGFWAAGHDYFLVLSPDTETVDSLTVVKVIGTFSIENRCVNWAKVVSPTTTVGLTGTTFATSQIVASVTGAVGSVTGAVGSVTGAVGSVTGNVGGNVTGSVGSVVGAVGSVTGAVGSVTGAVGSVTGAVGSVTGNVGGNVTGSVGSVVGAVGSVTGAVGSVTGMTAGDVGAIKAKTDNLPAAPAAVGDIPTANQNRDAVWAKAMSDMAAAPTATAAASVALNWLFMLARNQIEETATAQTLRKDDSTTSVAAATTSDDGTTFTRGKFA